MKKKNKDIMIVSQAYEEAISYGEDLKNLKLTIKKVKMFVKSKVNRQSAEC
ncbi:MAG: hypothetical protein WC069_03165 [Candidatus Shapirobacteria bacterium]